MALAFVQKIEQQSALTVGAVPSYTPPLPAGVAAGNLLVMVVHTTNYPANDPAPAAPTGWTSVIASAAFFGDGSERRYIFVKKAVTSEPNPTLNAAGSVNTYWHVAFLEYSGQDPTTPLDGTASSGTIDTDANVNLPAITTTVNNSLVIYVAADGPNNNSWTAPSGATQRVNRIDTTTAGSIAVSEKLQATAGTVATTNYVRGAITQSAIGATLAIRPAPTSTTWNGSSTVSLTDTITTAGSRVGVVVHGASVVALTATVTTVSRAVTLHASTAVSETVTLTTSAALERMILVPRAPGALVLVPRPPDSLVLTPR